MDTQWVLRNYQYGVASHLGIGNEKAAVDQMFARNRLRNALVELQLKMSDQYRTIISSENPAAARLLEIKEEIKTLRGAIKAMRARKAGEDPHWTGRRIAKSPEKARISELKSEAVRLRDISNEIINANRKKLSATIKKLDRDHSAAAHEIYQRAFEGYAYTDQTGKTVSVVPLYHRTSTRLFGGIKLTPSARPKIRRR